MVRTRSALGMAIATSLAFAGFLACVGDDPADTAQGAQGQACFANQTCLAGLACVANICQLATEAGGTSGNASSSTSGNASSTSSSGNASSSSTSSSGAPPPACTGTLPTMGAGPSCPANDAGSCASGQVCCPSAASLTTVICAENSGIVPPAACSQEFAFVECSTTKQCAGAQRCCLRGSPSAACAYNLASTRCKTACTPDEIALCSSGDPTCRDDNKTCQPITIAFGGIVGTAGGCL